LEASEETLEEASALFGDDVAVVSGAVAVVDADVATGVDKGPVALCVGADTVPLDEQP